MAVGLYNPDIVINNQKIVFRANSVEITEGKGEAKVEALSGGAGIVVTGHSEDVSTKIGKVKFIMYVNDKTREEVRTWKSLPLASINISVSERDSHFTFRHMTMTTDPSLMLNSAPEVEVEFQGDPAI